MNEGNEGYKEVNIQCADLEDWSQNCVPIGIKVEGENRPWVEMTRSEMGVLYALLTKQLTLVTPKGIVRSPPVCEDNPGLKKLADSLNAMMRWVDTHHG